MKGVLKFRAVAVRAVSLRICYLQRGGAGRAGMGLCAARCSSNQGGSCKPQAGQSLHYESVMQPRAVRHVLAATFAADPPRSCDAATTTPPRMTSYLPLLGALVLLSPPLTSHAGGEPAPLASMTRSSETGHADGTIVGIDAERGRITLKHGAIEGLGMPAMTMVFRVADLSMLTQLKAGDGVRFTVIRADNLFTVTQLVRR